MSEQTRKQVNYTVACIHEFARRKEISQRDAFLFLQQYRGISFLNEFYDVEHTLSMNDATHTVLYSIFEAPKFGRNKKFTIHIPFDSDVVIRDTSLRIRKLFKSKDYSQIG